MSGNIKVVVRCRPLNSREIARGAKCLIRMEAGTHTFLEPPHVEEDPASQSKNSKALKALNHQAERETKSFAFDHSYWSAGPKDEAGYASQETLYQDLGVDLLNNSFEGYNSCIFAYGQTGSGKSYSMMGYGQDRGIIPLTCSALFDRIQEKMAQDSHVVYTVEVSFMEIYNERVRDLLNPKNKGNLRVREHPSLGPYVEDLSKLAVRSYPDVETLMDEGNKARTVAATNMNETSSRSHSVFTLLLTQRRKDVSTGMEGEKVSRISLVDLAGSERANSTGATGVRLKEGAQINKSLTTLGKVISALALAGGATGPGKKKKPEEHIPYRDSVLTWLLKDSLGGNSKTAMIAAISPADYEETLSTLRYADQAKKIKNKAVVNEDPNAKLIRELKEELTTLRSRISGDASEDTYDTTLPPEKQIVTYQTKTGEIKKVTKAVLQEQLEQSEKLMSEVAQTWEEKLMKTEVVQKEREQALEELGITIEKNHVGVHTPKRTPHLVNLNEDPLMSECLIYQIKLGTTTVGNTDATTPCDIRLSGTNILSPHCHFESDKESSTVHLIAHENAPTMVNGKRLSPGVPKKLRSGYRVILGDYHIFRFNHPEEVRKHREKVKSTIGEGGNHELKSSSMDTNGELGNGSISPMVRPDTPTSSSVIDPQDYHYARKEVVFSKLNGSEVNLDEMDEAEFERLFDDVVRAKMHRKSGTSASGRESRMSFISEEEDDLLPQRPPSGSTVVTDDTSVTDSNLQEIDPRFRMAFTDDGNQFKSLVGLGTESSGMDADRLRLEREQLENQMKVMKQEMEQRLAQEKQKFRRTVKKLKIKTRTSIPEEDEGSSDLELEEYTDAEKRLLLRSVRKWKSLNRVRLAENLLTKAIILKEANVISKELGKMVTYQFVILDRAPFEVTCSNLESIKGLNEFDDVSDPVLGDRSNRPCIGVKVLDGRHRSVYVWSLAKLEIRLGQMRNLYNFIDKPEFSQHFNWEDPFYDSSPPTYSFIAHSFIPLGPLYRNIPVAVTLPLCSPYTLTAIGSCRARVRVIGIAPPTRTGILLNTPSGSAIPYGPPNLCPYAEGSRLTLEILVDQVDGLTSREFSSIHCQIRTSSLAGKLKDGVDDQVYSSKGFDLPCDSNEIGLKQLVTIAFSPEARVQISQGCGVVEFFGQVMPSYLDRLEKMDEKKNEESDQLQQKHLCGRTPACQSGQPEDQPEPAGSGSDGSGMRRPETEFVCEQNHDVTSLIRMLELSSGGDYEPTPIISQNGLDPGAFDLRQGLQRKLMIRLGHNSGRQLGWSRFSKVEMGNVRLIDGQGRIHGSKLEKWVNLTPSKKVMARFEPDGTSSLEFIGNWDAGGHESSYLNRVTQAQQRVLVELRWSVEVKGCVEPVAFKTDIAMSIKDRDQSLGLYANSLLSILRLERRLKSMNFLFSIKLKPMTVNRVHELWRLNTNHRVIRGEEKLKKWKARSVGLLVEFLQFKESIALKNQVSNLRIIVDALGYAPQVPADPRLLELGHQDHQEVDLFKIGKSLELWQKRFGPKDCTTFWDLAKPSTSTYQQEPGEVRLSLSDLPSTSTPQTPRPALTRKLKAEVILVPKHENAVKKGRMNVLRDPTRNDWVNRWFTLKRPYLYIYEKSDEADELGVINLMNVHLDSNPELEVMLNRKNVFAIYSATNSYFLETMSSRELVQWSLAIKPAVVE